MAAITKNDIESAWVGMADKLIQNLISTLFAIGVVIVGTWIGHWVRKSRVSAQQGIQTMATSTSPSPTGNRLIHESSPYLLQHAHNPVDWYPWSDVARERARREDKPIFLSIGYSSCHWCHVMERESFDNAEIAAILNRYFVCIKVDREQRPDIDQLYMNAVQAMTGSGGWPLSVFLAPDGRPFFGGTYFPPEDRFGHPGFPRVLHAIAEAWEKRRDELLQSADDLQRILERDTVADSSEPNEALLSATLTACQGLFDSQYGGFGAAPKFPQPAILAFLLRAWQRDRDPQTLAMVTQTLDRMARGGIYDHLGGGFHRYATDAAWQVPHFEKMLYDQAQLAQVYLDAYKVTGEPNYVHVTRAILDYVLRDMTDAQGGFYSAEDADSEGHEGTFYTWTADQVVSVLGPEKAEPFMAAYGVTAGGNFEHGTNILHVETPSDPGLPWAQARRILWMAREKRIHPFKDEKVITAWNGLMIGPLADAGRCLAEPRYVVAAERAAAFVLDSLRVKGRLQRSCLGGQCSGPGYLDDYAFLTQGLLTLYETTLEPKWLLAADGLAQTMIDLFSDPRGGALFLTGPDAESLLVRDKPLYDGAVPSGNAVAAMVLFRLSRITTKDGYRRQATAIVAQAAPSWRQSALAHVALACAFDYERGPTREITLAGNLAGAPGQAMLGLLYRNYRPNTVVVYRPDGDDADVFLHLAAYTRDQRARDGQPTAYVCENGACRTPVYGVAPLATLLGITDSSQ